MNWFWKDENKREERGNNNEIWPSILKAYNDIETKVFL